MIRRIGNGPPLSNSNTTTVVTTRRNEKVWINKANTNVERIDCIVPHEIEQVLYAINEHFPEMEFSILCKSIMNTSERIIQIRKEYYIPHQVVSGGFVDYKEDCLEYDTVIHKHPPGVRQFSSTDEAYINQNFTVSLLWLPRGGFVQGIVRLKTDFGFVKVPLNIQVVRSTKRKIKGIEKIVPGVRLGVGTQGGVSHVLPNRHVPTPDLLKYLEDD